MGLLTFKEWVELIFTLILILILGWIAWTWHGMKQQVADLQAYKAAAVPIAAATQEGILHVNASEADRQAADASVAQSRAVKDRHYNEAIRHDQKAADWASTPIPDSVRASEADTAPIDRSSDSASGSEAADIAAYNRWSVPRPKPAPHKR